MASIGALFVVSRSRPATLFSATFASGDVIALIAMFGWSAYTLLQTRVGAALSNLARVCVFAFAGALFSLPPACCTGPEWLCASVWRVELVRKEVDNEYGDR